MGAIMSTNRRQYTAEFKAKVVLQVLMGENTSAEICRSHKLHSSVLNRWRKEYLEHAATIFAPGGDNQEDQQRIAELEQLVGQLTLQLEIAKKASQALTPTRNGRW
jgi:transposase-like protein